MNKRENHEGTISFTFDAILKFSLKKELDELAQLAKDGNLLDWKSPIVLASSYLEMVGLEKLLQRENVKNLKQCFKIIKKPPKIKKEKNDLRWFNLFKIALLLRNYGLITRPLHAVKHDFSSLPPGSEKENPPLPPNP